MLTMNLPTSSMNFFLTFHHSTLTRFSMFRILLLLTMQQLFYKLHFHWLHIHTNKKFPHKTTSKPLDLFWHLMLLFHWVHQINAFLPKFFDLHCYFSLNRTLLYTKLCVLLLFSSNTQSLINSEQCLEELTLIFYKFNNYPNLWMILPGLPGSIRVNTTITDSL